MTLPERHDETSARQYRYALTPEFRGGEEDALSLIPPSPPMRQWRAPRALSALREVFSHYLQHGGVATIFTSSGARYISSCVTGAVEDGGGTYSRTFEEDTRIVTIVHEWGVYHPHTQDIAAACHRRGVPLVESYAYATGLFFRPDAPIYGDFIILSLRKFFGAGLEGVLLAPPEFHLKEGAPLEAGQILLPPPAQIRKARRQVWAWYVESFNLPPEHFSHGSTGDYGAFLLPCTPAHEFLRLGMREQGIEGGYWYGNSHLFLPVHQGLSREDVQAIADIINDAVRLEKAPSFSSPFPKP